jgi:transposase
VKVIIGVDPHKGSHTAVAIGSDETRLAAVKVRSSRRQLDQLLEWAARFEQRTWAIESAGGLGYLLAQQLVGAGEQVLDVPATLAARVRVLGTGRSNKNDPNDAHSVAVAALRAPRLSSVARADHRGVLRLLAKRNNELGRTRNKTACRLHALLAELVPGGIPNEINAASAERTLAGVKPQSPVEVARHALALEHLDDLRRVDAQMRTSKARIAEAIAASGTSLTELFGVGPVVAAMLIGYTGDVARFRNRDHFAAYTGAAPIEVSSAGGSLIGFRGGATASSTMPFTSPRSPRSASGIHRAARSSSARSPRARPRRKPCVRSSGASPMPSTDSSSSTPARTWAREGNRGRLFNPAWPAQHPDGRLFGSATPGPEPTLEPAGPPRERQSHLARQPQPATSRQQRGIR